MSELGERVALAYGWKHKTTHYGTDWIEYDETRRHDRALHRQTPDPENSWADFGRLLEWARNHNVGYSIQVDRDGATIMAFDMATGGSEFISSPEDYVEGDFRRAVTEAILEVVENE